MNLVLFYCPSQLTECPVHQRSYLGTSSFGACNRFNSHLNSHSSLPWYTVRPDFSAEYESCVIDLLTSSRLIPTNFAASTSWSSNGAESFSSSASFSCAARDLDVY
jgi:hypothetical protein